MLQINKNIKIKLLIYLFYFTFNNLNGLTIGNPLTVQGNILFSGADNRIANDAIMSNGFAFENNVVSCSVDSYFPVKGTINFNDGRVYLERDSKLKSFFNLIGGGRVYGEGYSLRLPDTQISYNLGSALSFVNTIGTGGVINSVDWSYDDDYLVACTNTDDVLVYYFDGSSLSLTASWDVGVNVNSCRWHPSSHYLAVGANANVRSEIRIYYYNTTTGDFSITSEINGSTNIFAVAWSIDGQYLATLGADNNLNVYSFSAGVLSGSPVATVNHPGGDVQDDAMSWQASGDHIVIGTTGVSADIWVFAFDGMSLNINASVELGTTVNDVDWQSGSSFILAALGGGEQRVQIYEHDHSSGSLILRNGIDEAITYYSANWRGATDFFVVGKSSGVGSEVRVYSFDSGDYTIINRSNQEASSNVNSERWDGDGNYLAIGENDGDLTVYNFISYSSGIFLDDINLVFNSNTEINETVTFCGNCVLDGRDHRIVLNIDEAFVVFPKSTLTLKNVDLRGLAGKNIMCLQNDSAVIFQDCKITLSDNFEFDTGSILFKSDVVISGTSSFLYSSRVSSTIDFYSTLCIDSGITFSYAPKIAKRNLLHMQDDSSYLYLNNCSLYSTKTGLCLTKGKLFIDSNVTFSGYRGAISESICFGNNSTTEDLDVFVLAGAQLDVHGFLDYKNTE
ncbi:WD40 repeat domain-containing protein [Candidatus Dependentiae bacterium]